MNARGRPPNISRAPRARLLVVVAAAIGLLAMWAGSATAEELASAPNPPVSPSGAPQVPLSPLILGIPTHDGPPLAPQSPPPPVTTPSPRICPGKVKAAPWGSPKPYLCERTPGNWVPAGPEEIKQPYDSAPSPWDVDHSEKDHCGFIDLPCQVRGAMTAWFAGLVKSAIGPTFKFLGATVFATPSLNSSSMERARELWSSSRWIADTCFGLLVTLAGILLITGTSLPRELGVREILPRLLWGFLAANLSLDAIGYGIDLANGLANAFLRAGREHIDVHQAAEVLARTMESAAKSSSAYVIIIALVAVLLAGCVAFTYVTRLALTLALIAVAPVALMFHALPFTQGLAALWWRGIAGMLAIQVCQSLVFVTALQILLSFDPSRTHSDTFFTIPTNGQDGIDLLLIIALMWVLLRIPFWVARTVWNQAQPRMLNNLIKTFILYRAVGSLTGRGRGRGRGAGHQQPRPSSTPRPASPRRPNKPQQGNWTAQPTQIPVSPPRQPSASGPNSAWNGPTPSMPWGAPGPLPAGTGGAAGGGIPRPGAQPSGFPYPTGAPFPFPAAPGSATVPPQNARPQGVPWVLPLPPRPSQQGHAPGGSRPATPNVPARPRPTRVIPSGQDTSRPFQFRVRRDRNSRRP